MYVILQQISFKNQKFEIHELIDISATMLPPMFIAFIAEMFLGDGSLKLLPVHCVVLLCYGIFVYVFFNKGFYAQSKSLLSGMLCGSLLSESCATVEIMA